MLESAHDQRQITHFIPNVESLVENTVSFYCIVWVWVDSGLSLFYAAISNSYRSGDYRGGLEVLPVEGA